MQITSLLFLPDFPGWTAPLHFNPVRFEELLILIITLCVSWVSACGILGGYKTVATSGECCCMWPQDSCLTRDFKAISIARQEPIEVSVSNYLMQISRLHWRA